MGEPSCGVPVFELLFNRSSDKMKQPYVGSFSSRAVTYYNRVHFTPIIFLVRPGHYSIVDLST